MVSPTHRACCHSPRAPPSSVAIPVATTTRAPDIRIRSSPQGPEYRASALAVATSMTPVIGKS